MFINFLLLCFYFLNHFFNNYWLRMYRSFRGFWLRHLLVVLEELSIVLWVVWTAIIVFAAFSRRKEAQLACRRAWKTFAKLDRLGLWLEGLEPLVNDHWWSRQTRVCLPWHTWEDGLVSLRVEWRSCVGVGSDCLNTGLRRKWSIIWWLVTRVWRIVGIVLAIAQRVNVLLVNSLITLALVRHFSICRFQVLRLHFPERLLPVRLQPVKQLFTQVVVAESTFKCFNDRVNHILVELISSLLDFGVVHFINQIQY